jgi:hypothetical protein
MPVVLVAAGYGVFEVFRSRTFQSFLYNPAILDQAARSYSHFQLGISAIQGLHSGFDPPTLLIADAVLLALAIPLAWLAACLLVILLPGAAGGAARLGGWAGPARSYPDSRNSVSAGSAQFRGTIGLGAAAVMLVPGALLVPKFGFSAARRAPFYVRSAQVPADAAVRPGVEVDGGDKLGPRLSARDMVLLGGAGGEIQLLAVPWVVANGSQRPDTFNNIGEQRQRVLLLGRGVYRIIFERDGYLVLHRGGLLAGHGSYKEAAR